MYIHVHMTFHFVPSKEVNDIVMSNVGKITNHLHFPDGIITQQIGDKFLIEK